MKKPEPDLTKAQMDVFDYLVENCTEFRRCPSLCFSWVPSRCEIYGRRASR